MLHELEPQPGAIACCPSDKRDASSTVARLAARAVWTISLKTKARTLSRFGLSIGFPRANMSGSMWVLARVCARSFQIRRHEIGLFWREVWDHVPLIRRHDVGGFVQRNRCRAEARSLEVLRRTEQSSWNTTGAERWVLAGPKRSAARGYAHSVRMAAHGSRPPFRLNGPGLRSALLLTRPRFCVILPSHAGPERTSLPHPCQNRYNLSVPLPAAAP